MDSSGVSYIQLVGQSILFVFSRYRLGTGAVYQIYLTTLQARLEITFAQLNEHFLIWFQVNRFIGA